MKECLAYWERIAGIDKYICPLFLVVSVIFFENILIMIACVYCINQISLAMFSGKGREGNKLLTLSLPISRKNLWDTRMWAISGAYFLYGLFLCFRNEGNRLFLLLIISILLFAHIICGICLRKRELYLLSGVPGLMLIFIFMGCVLWERAPGILNHLEHNMAFFAGFTAVNCVLLVLDIRIWGKERNRFIEGVQYD